MEDIMSCPDKKITIDSTTLRFPEEQILKLSAETHLYKNEANDAKFRFSPDVKRADFQRVKMSWIDECFSRLLIDNHTTDLKEEFMSRFSASEYVRLVEMSGVEAAMVYACNHVGNCFYPTKVGHIHQGMKGHDCFGETIALLRQKGIAPIAYYTATYHNDCAKKLPHTRLIDNMGMDHLGRYYYTCPNQPDAVDFYKQQIAEILQYDIDGIFIDMTFWPSICCCDGCRRKFGRPLPEVIDWSDPNWVAFQRFREDSMAEFAKDLTEFARSCKPGVTVVHQFSPVLHGWYLGQSAGIAEASDYTSGDFYGGNLQHRLGAKVFDAFTQQRPFEFMTSRCVSLRDHTSNKSPDEMLLNALTTLANGGAYFFIDAINPDGTLNAAFYERLGEFNRKLTPFRECIKHLQGELAGDIGLYFSMPSCVDTSWNGRRLMAFNGGHANNMEIRKNAVMDETLGCAEVLLRQHYAWKIVTPLQRDLKGLKALIICNAAYLSLDECERIREFVAQGGTLIATGAVSKYDIGGHSGGDFALADVLGVHDTGELSDTITYTGEEFILAEGRVPLVKADAETSVRERLTFPDFPADDPDNYASIHSNPPGRQTDYPALTLHAYGKGRCIWMAAPIAMQRIWTQQEYLKRLFAEFLPEFVVEAVNLPESAEVTLLANQDRTQMVLGIVNGQDAYPVIPLRQVSFSIPMATKPVALTLVSSGESLPIRWENHRLKISLNSIHYAEFIKLTYAKNS